jgi:hypothetical protein
MKYFSIRKLGAEISKAPFSANNHKLKYVPEQKLCIWKYMRSQAKTNLLLEDRHECLPPSRLCEK